MKIRYLILGIVLIMLNVFSVFSVSYYGENLTIGSDTLNSNIIFGENVSISNVTISSSAITLTNITFGQEAYDSNGDTTDTLDSFIITASNSEYNTHAFQYKFKFYDTTVAVYLEDFEANDLDSFDDELRIWYDAILPSNTWTFLKESYNEQDLTFDYNITRNNSFQINTTPVAITMKMYSFSSPSTQLTFNVTMKDTTSYVYENEFNLSKNYSEVPHGAVRFLVSSEGYSDASFYQTITPYTSISFDGLLTPSNESALYVFTVLDLTGSNPLSDVVVEARILQNGTYNTVSQGKTGGNGETYMYLDSSYEYQFIFTKDGYVQAIANSIPSVTSYTVKLKDDQTVFEYIDDVNILFTPIQTYLYVNTTYNFTLYVVGEGVTNMDWTIYDGADNVLYNKLSSNPTGSTFVKSLTVPVTGEITSVLVFTKDGKTSVVTKTYSVKPQKDGYLEYFRALAKDSDYTLLFFIIFMIMQVSAAYFASTIDNEEVALILIPVWMGFAFIDVITFTLAAALSAAALFLYVGGYKK